MNNSLLRIKVIQRLNKIASNDFDNIECWQVVEAFNKAQLDWARRQIGGNNIRKEGAEQSIRRIDDLQILLIPSLQMGGTIEPLVFTSVPLPANYLAYSRITVLAKSPKCPDGVRMKVHLAEEANVDDYLRDAHIKPSLEWAETFGTFASDRIRVYSNEEFTVERVELTYYRKPVSIEIAGCVNPNTGDVSGVDVECEFKDDIVEILVDETAAIIAGDIENVLQAQRNNNEADQAN